MNGVVLTQLSGSLVGGSFVPKAAKMGVDGYMEDSPKICWTYTFFIWQIPPKIHEDVFKKGGPGLKRGGGAWTKHLLINGDLQSCLPGSGVYFYILCWQSIPLVWSVGCLGVISWLLGCHQLANTLLGLAFGWSLPTVYSHRFCRFVSFCIRAKVHQWKFSDNDILQHPQVMISSYFLQKILCSHYKF